MTTNNATLREARAAGIDAAIEAVKDHTELTEDSLLRGLPDAGRHYSAAAKLVVPSILEALRKLAAETRKAEPVKPNPFEGWTIQPWEGDELCATDERGNSKMVGLLYMGWAAWRPLEAHEIDQGPETGDEGRALAEKALVEAGANIPWHRDTTSADLIEAAGRG